MRSVKKILLVLLALILLTGCSDYIEIKSYSTKFVNLDKNMKHQDSYQIKTSVRIGDNNTCVQITNIGGNGITERITDITSNGMKEYEKSYTIYNGLTKTTYSYTDESCLWSKSEISGKSTPAAPFSLEFLNDDNAKFLKKEDNLEVYDVKVIKTDYIFSVLDNNLRNRLSSAIPIGPTALDNVKYEIYIDPESNLVRRIYIDLTRAVSTQTTLGKGYVFDINIEFGNFDNVSVSVPEYVVEQFNETDRIQTKYSFKNKYPYIPYTRKLIPLDFNATDAIHHPTEPIIYMISGESKRFYEINYSNGKRREISFGISPKCLAFHDNKIYIALSDMKDYADTYENSAVTVIDATTLFTVHYFDIYDIDPYDIEVDSGGFIYVTPDINEGINMNRYDPAGYLTYSVYMNMRCSIKYNSFLNGIYCIDPYSGSKRYDLFLLSKMPLQRTRVQINEKDNLSSVFDFSPDGKLIFNGSGNIITDTHKAYKSLKYGFDDIAFDLPGDSFFTSHGRHILKYDYSGMNIKGYYQTYGFIETMFFHDDSLATICRDIYENYFIEIIDEK